jgi:hypothetical protein
MIGANRGKLPCSAGRRRDEALVLIAWNGTRPARRCDDDVIRCHIISLNMGPSII